MKFSSLSIFCLALVFMALPAILQAQTQSPNADIQALRTQIEALKTEYQARIESLEKQLEEVQAQMLRVPDTTAPAAVAAPATAASPGALNPAISVVSNFLGRADNQKVFLEGTPTRIDNTFNLREAEIDMRVPVDPYSDAVLITSFESEVPGQFTASVEEGYINIRKLPFMSSSPLGLKFQVGRFRPAFGKFNLLHMHDLPQSTRSLLTEEFLGDDGFISQGVSTDFYIPTPWSDTESLNARLQVITGGDVAISPDWNHRMAYLGNLRWFKTIAGTHNTEVGWSSYWHPGTATTPIARMHAIDFMYRWKPFRQGEWKSYLLGGEVMFSDPVDSATAGDVRRPKGTSVFTQWQFDRRKYGGVRFDYTTTIADPALQRKSVTPYFSYYFSEFLRMRLNFERRWSDIATEDHRNTLFAELNWIFGSHPPEPFWVNK